MPVKVRCTSCEKVLNAPDAARGKAIKCPACETKIAVPAEGADDEAVRSTKSAKPAASSKTKSKAPVKEKKPHDSEDALASFDLRRADDTEARVCAKCGHDMQYQDEEDTECPKCGFDSSVGGLGKRATKKAMKGPDPADFYPNLFMGSWKFVGKNQGLAWRTTLYTFICLVISLGCALMYLWMADLPPRAFFILCFTVAFMVIPGWLSMLDTEVIKLTLERKDRFKKLNFDFFHSSAMGLQLLAWLILVALPIMALPLGIAYYLVKVNGQSPVVGGVICGIAAIPVIMMLPIAMSHFCMPVQSPAWMVWRLVPALFRTIKAASVWFLLWLFTMSPILGGLAAIAGIWGNDINRIVVDMEANAKTIRARRYEESKPKGKNPVIVDPESLGKIVEVDLKPLIAPSITLLLLSLPLGYLAMFNMRTNGQFTYFNKNALELVDKAKEYKYVSRMKRDEDGELIEDTTGKDQRNGAILCVLGAVLIGYGVYEAVQKVSNSGETSVRIRRYGPIGLGVSLLGTGIGAIARAGVRPSTSPPPDDEDEDEEEEGSKKKK